MSRNHASPRFDCHLERPPPGEPLGDTAAAGTAGKPAPQPVTDYNGKTLAFVVADKVAGGCGGQDVAGLHWVCFAGERAVTEKIIGPSSSARTPSRARAVRADAAGAAPSSSSSS